MDVKKLTYRLVQAHTHPNKKGNKLGERKERGEKLGREKKKKIFYPGTCWGVHGGLCLAAAKETIIVIATTYDIC